MASDSNLSRPTTGNEKPPIRQHKRLAMGMKVDGQTNPYGAAKGSTTKTVANAPKTY